MNYARFRFLAVVDWIELEIQTMKPTNAGAMRRHGELSYATPRDAGDGGAATIFRFKLYDPESWHEVTTKLQAIADAHPLATPPKVTAIEISFDAYSSGASHEEMSELTARFYKYMTHPVSANRRLYHELKGGVKAMPLQFDSLVRHVGEGWQIGIGNKTDDHYQHAYLKTTDKGGQQLEEDEHRARVEITLRGAGLPCQTLKEWECFNFTTLTKFFNFRELKPDLDPTTRAWAEKIRQIGERKQRWRVKNDLSGYSGERLYAKATKADCTLNDQARYKLRVLSQRWQVEPTHIKSARLSGK